MAVQLTIVQGKPQGQALFFGQGEFVFGRGPECHVRPNSDWVSRQHCLLRISGDSIHLKDLGSTNGTLVNGDRLIGERELHIGDVLQIGPLIFQVDSSSAKAPKQSVALNDTANFSPIGTVSDTRFE